MSILDWLDKTRQKSESVRRRISLLLTFFIMLVIAAVWLSLVLFSSSEQPASAEQKSPFSIFVDMFDF